MGKGPCVHDVSRALLTQGMSTFSRDHRMAVLRLHLHRTAINHLSTNCSNFKDLKSILNLTKERSYATFFATGMVTVTLPGSLRAKHPIFSLLVKGVIHLCFCSSEPNLSIGPKYRDFKNLVLLVLLEATP